jgi:hypothetical protein
VVDDAPAAVLYRLELASDVKSIESPGASDGTDRPARRARKRIASLSVSFQRCDRYKRSSPTRAVLAHACCRSLGGERNCDTN